MSEEPTTPRLRRDWELAKVQLSNARSKWNRAETHLLNATNALGKRLDPGDQEFGEVVSVWVSLEGNEETLLQSIKDGDGDYRVRKRQKGNPLEPLKRMPG